MRRRARAASTSAYRVTTSARAALRTSPHTCARRTPCRRLTSAKMASATLEQRCELDTATQASTPRNTRPRCSQRAQLPGPNEPCSLDPTSPAPWTQSAPDDQALLPGPKRALYPWSARLGRALSHCKTLDTLGLQACSITQKVRAQAAMC